VETSLEEEQMLRDYFARSTNVPDAFESYKAQFQYFESIRADIGRRPELERKLEYLLDRESRVKTIAFYKKKPFSWIAAAAMVIIIGSMILILNRNQEPDLGTFNDPELAYIEAQKTMLYISQTLNYGTKELSRISKINSGVENLRNLEKLNAGFDKLKLLSKIDETSTEVNQ